MRGAFAAFPARRPGFPTGKDKPAPAAYSGEISARAVRGSGIAEVRIAFFKKIKKCHKIIDILHNKCIMIIVSTLKVRVLTLRKSECQGRGR